MPRTNQRRSETGTVGLYDQGDGWRVPVFRPPRGWRRDQLDILPALADGSSRLAAGGHRLGLRVGSPFNGPCLMRDLHARTDRPSRGV